MGGWGGVWAVAWLCIAKLGYVSIRYVCVNGRVKVTDRKWATIKTGKVVLLATTCTSSEVANLREILTLGEGFNTQVVTLWCFNIVVREILTWGRVLTLR